MHKNTSRSTSFSTFIFATMRARYTEKHVQNNSLSFRHKPIYATLPPALWPLLLSLLGRKACSKSHPLNSTDSSRPTLCRRDRSRDVKQRPTALHARNLTNLLQCDLVIFFPIPSKRHFHFISPRRETLRRNGFHDTLML